ncbi:hypothetical protein JXO52_01730 [bacterium]|nr:hypothetical protein [bacterium]
MTGAEIIERGNPHFALPTTGVIVNDLFYYIANSQIYRTDEHRKLLPAEQLDEVVILKTVLN